MNATLFSAAKELICPHCEKTYSLSAINTYAQCCNEPLLVKYDYSIPIEKTALFNRVISMWRYFEMLPVKDEKNIVSLGEGMTPLIQLHNAGFPFLYMKDESTNPTGSFKARGMSVAVSKMKELGIERCIIPTAGNAGVALSAYCAKANIACTVVMPEHSPSTYKDECKNYGAELILVKGLINDCAKKVEELKKQGEYFDVSTMKEPYRLEGKKTMGYEIAEQLNWELPDVIICPVGGGTGLIGIWKGLQEMIELGWINKPLPKMIAVQAENCAPVAASLKDPENWKENFTPKPSIAFGLAVPFPFALNLMKTVIKDSNGDVIVVSENEIADGINEIQQKENMQISAEGAAAYKALAHMLDQRLIRTDDKIVFLNTGSNYEG